MNDFMALSNDLVRFNIESVSDDGVRALENALEQEGIAFALASPFIAVDRSHKDLVGVIVRRIRRKHPARRRTPQDNRAKESLRVAEQSRPIENTMANGQSSAKELSPSTDETLKIAEQSSSIKEEEAGESSVTENAPSIDERKQRTSDRIGWWYVYAIIFLPIVALPVIVFGGIIGGDDGAMIAGLIISLPIPVLWIIGNIWSWFD